MRITEIVIKDYQGIEFLKVSVPDQGVVFEGRNGVGKTSSMDAVAAALIGSGIKPEHVRVGADKSEIMIKLDSGEKVRRVIRREGGTEIGMLPSPEGGATERLRALLKPGVLDPLAFYLAKEDQRRQLLLDAMPVKVTEDDVLAWTGAPAPAGVNMGANGLEVLRKVRARYYEDRTRAKAAAKAAGARAETAAEVATKAYAAIGGTPIAETEAQEQAASARGRLAKLEARQAELGTISAVETEVSGMLAQDEKIMAQIPESEGPTDAALTEAAKQCQNVAEEIALIKQALANAERRAGEVTASFDDLRRARAVAQDAVVKRIEISGRIERYRASLAKVAQDKEARAVSDEEVAAANAEVDSATAAVARAKRSVEFNRADADRAAAEESVATATREVARLEAIMDKLGTEAPRALAERGTIPGLDFENMTLDGVPIATLNGARQMAFAVDLAKRIGSEVKVHLVDGLERLDPESEAAFLAAATADGWQLIGTKVTGGKELVLHAIGD